MKIAGLEIKVERTAYSAYGILGLIPFLVMSGFAVMFRPQKRHVRTFIEALLVGVSVAMYHAIAQFTHQSGHALAARATGYPMTGIRYEYAFTYSEYPPDEPPLPDNVHLQRSLGGVGGVTLMLVIVVLLWLRVSLTANWFTHWLFAFLLLDSLLLFVASAVFSDGVMFVLEKGRTETQPDA